MPGPRGLLHLTARARPRRRRRGDDHARELPPRRPRDGLHLRRPAAEVRRRRRRRDRLRPQPVRRRGGSWSSPTRGWRRPGIAAAGRRPDGPVRHRGRRSSTASMSSRPTRACSAADRATPAGTGPWDALRRGRRRVDHRHRQGGQPAGDQRRRADGLRQRAGRGGPGPGRTRSSRWSPCPTTTGTGAESTTICVLDVLSLKVKTGISHARLRPTLAVIDPALTLTQPAGVTAAGRHGHPVPCPGELHRALVHRRTSASARAAGALLRLQPDLGHVVGEGAAPAGGVVPHRRPPRRRRRGPADMALAATFAGLGFGNAGVHIPHANAYPIAGRVRDFHPKDYPADEPMVPHGMSVALTAPEAFRFTFDGRRRSGTCARPQLLAPGADGRRTRPSSCPSVLIDLMRDIEHPQRDRRRRLRRVRHRRPGRRDHQAAAAAGDLRRGRSPRTTRRHLPALARTVVTRTCPSRPALPPSDRSSRRHPVPHRPAAAVPLVRRHDAKGPVPLRDRGAGRGAARAGADAPDLEGHVRRGPR